VIKQYEQSKQTIWFDEELLDIPDIHRCCDVDYWKDADLIVGSAKGRGTTWFIQLPQMQAALRHYRRGGLFGKLINDHYLYLSHENTRSYQEFFLLQKLYFAGVSVPRPIAACIVKKTVCYQADLLSERIANAQDLVSVLQTRTLSAEIYQNIGLEIAKMHQVSVNHTDLNIHNLLLDENDKVWIIDFDKCKQIDTEKADAWKRHNLARLLRSFEKEQVKAGINWNRSQDWPALLAGYHGLK
jgi:3-deoxy-D-manno-octulosonic acid kinase